MAAVPVASPPPPARASRTVVWHGSFLEHHSLALVNRRIAGALAGSGDAVVIANHHGGRDFAPGEGGDEPRALVEALRRTPRGGADVIHVTHRWPPFLAPPGRGRWIAFQPWEFGSMPRAWLAPFRDAADEVWVYTRWNRDNCVADGLSPERVSVIPLGVDLDRFRPDAPPLPRVAAATDRPFRFLFVGGTIRRKGIDVLVEAYLRAFTREDPVALVVKDFCQDGAYRGQNAGESLRRLAEDRRHPAIVYIPDRIAPADLPGLYTACDVLVHPYRGEGFGLPVAEALASGRPVIVTRGGACDDFCVEGPTLFLSAVTRAAQSPLELVRPGSVLEPSVETLTALLRSVFERRRELPERGAAARAHAVAVLSWDRTLHAVRDALDRVLARPPRRC